MSSLNLWISSCSPVALSFRVEAEDIPEGAAADTWLILPWLLLMEVEVLASVRFCSIESKLASPSFLPFTNVHCTLTMSQAQCSDSHADGEEDQGIDQ